ncbi:hypothetical protein BH23CHL2_BH23CHL2_00840 [soil metagenome]
MAQIADHRDLLTGYQPGDLQASERIVRVYQNEMLRASYLLTGSADGAVLLARDAFLDFFRRLLRGDAPDDPREGLLQSLGQEFLAEPGQREDPNGDRPASALAGTISFEAERQHYRVDDQRSRVLGALDLLDRPTRLGMVLRDFDALEEEPVCQILDETPFTLRQRLQPARGRLVDAAGATSDYSVRELLVAAATTAPRPNLWPEVAGPLEEIFAEEDERRQRYTYAAAGLVGLLLIIGGLWLFDVFPFGGGEGGQAAIAPTATPAPTPEPTASPTPIPELSSFAIPEGDVPGRILLGIGGIQAVQRVSETGFLDLESGSYTPHDELNQFGTPSPDGRFLLGLITPEQSPDQTARALAALDSDTGEQLWKAELPDGSYTFAVTLDRVYLTTVIAMDTSEAPSLLEFDLETGKLLSEHPDVVASILNDVTSTIRVMLRASPDNERLFIALEEFGSGPTTMLSRTVASYTLPDLTLESSSTETDTSGVRQFPASFSFADARVTPDGVYLYNVSQDTVQFRSSNLAEDLDHSLHFTTELPSGQRSDLRWITSNDGRYLYVVALERNEAAVVDLLARQVVYVFHLDTAAGIEPVRQVRPAALGDRFGAGLTLSPDGRYLYAAGGVTDDATTGNIERSIIWTIDLTTWTVIRSQEVPGLILSISQLGDRLIISVEAPPQDGGQSTNQVIAIDPETGDVVQEFGSDALPDWVDNFFAYGLPKVYHIIYGRAAAVDNISTSDVEAESTLPRVTVRSSSDTPPAGSTVNFSVRILNPVDGQLQAEPSDDVRFDPDSTVIIRLNHQEGEAGELILIANPTEPGLYRASSKILETGAWDATVTITDADGKSWSRTVEDFFEVVPSWEASNGSRYVMRVQTDPSEPPRGEEVELIVRFVEVDTGAPLPENVQILDSLPDELAVTFHSESNGVETATVARAGDGIYQGEISFEAVDTWEASIDIRFDDGERVQVRAGTVNVVR